MLNKRDVYVENHVWMRKFRLKLIFFDEDKVPKIECPVTRYKNEKKYN